MLRVMRLTFAIFPGSFYYDFNCYDIYRLEDNKMEQRKLVTPNDITTALKDIGVQKGQAVMVHTSLGSLGYVCGGAQSVIEALRALVMKVRL